MKFVVLKEKEYAFEWDIVLVINNSNDESELENPSKISKLKARKLFILSLYKIQNKVNGILELDQQSESVITDETPEDIGEQIKHEDDEEHEQDFDITHDSELPEISSATPAKKPISLAKVDKAYLSEIAVAAYSAASVNVL